MTITTFTSGTLAKASDVNENFQESINNYTPLNCLFEPVNYYAGSNLRLFSNHSWVTMGQYVLETLTGSWNVEYKFYIPNTGNYSFCIRYRSTTYGAVTTSVYINNISSGWFATANDTSDRSTRPTVNITQTGYITLGLSDSSSTKTTSFIQFGLFDGSRNIDGWN